MTQRNTSPLHRKPLQLLFLLRVRLYHVLKTLLRLPPLRRFMWKRWYQFLAGNFPDEDWLFMNYGYMSLDPTAPRIPLEPADELNRTFIQLYHHVAGAVDLHDKIVLEVGCGRGGGAAYIHRYLKPGSMTGIDFSPKAIAFCRSHHSGDGLTFLEGSAEELPFDDAAFDVVMSVESSHCYGSMSTFLEETERILKPGGYCLLADRRFKGDADTFRRQLDQCSLHLLSTEDIGANVLQALRLDSGRRLAFMMQRVPDYLVAGARDFVGAEGSTVWVGLETGGVVYLNVVLQKDLG